MEPSLAFRIAEISGKRKSNEGIMAPASHWCILAKRGRMPDGLKNIRENEDADLAP
jgi:hypothetical protein